MAYRGWCFTLNNPEEMLDLDDLPLMKYAVYQGEIGELNTYHFQGYIEFSRPVRMAHLRKYADLDRASFDPRRGTPDQARDYCMKEDTRQDGPYEFGDWSVMGAGKRNDIAAFKASIDEGKTDLDLWHAHPASFLRYHKAVSTVRLLLAGQRRNWPMEVEYLYGPPGSGKSRAAMDENPTAWWKNKGTWWCGYQGEATVVLDEFDGTWFCWTYLLKLLDRYPLSVETKGGQVPFLAKKIVITSNRPPWMLYNRWKQPLEALFRRITAYRLLDPHIPLRTCTEMWDFYQLATGQSWEEWISMPRPVDLPLK